MSAQHAVEFVLGHRLGGDPSDQVDVADPVDRVVHAVQPPVATQQEPVHAVDVLVGVPAHERLHPHPVLTDGEQAGGLKLLLPWQLDDELFSSRRVKSRPRSRSVSSMISAAVGFPALTGRSPRAVPGTASGGW